MSLPVFKDYRIGTNIILDSYTFKFKVGLKLGIKTHTVDKLRTLLSD